MGNGILAHAINIQTGCGKRKFGYICHLRLHSFAVIFQYGAYSTVITMSRIMWLCWTKSLNLPVSKSGGVIQKKLENSKQKVTPVPLLKVEKTPVQEVDSGEHVWKSYFPKIVEQLNVKHISLSRPCFQQCDNVGSNDWISLVPKVEKLSQRK